MKYESLTYTLSTGKTFYANRGIIGLSPQLEMFQGYDGHGPDVVAEEWHDDDDLAKVLNDAEREEIAAEMIGRWLAWAKSPRNCGG